jgi:hypothetical protein
MKSRNGITRRDFLKKVGLATTVATFGCATAETPKPEKASAIVTQSEPIVYPKLSNNKVQAPEKGCFIGFNKFYVPVNDPVFIGKQMDMAKRARNIDEYVEIAKKENIMGSIDIEGLVSNNIGYYEKAIGAKPSIYVLYDTPRLYLNFPMREAEAVAKNGVLPYINALPGSTMLKSLRFGLDEIVSGKRDSYLIKFAQGATEFGKKHGGFFMTTMEENNGYWYYWGQSSTFIPAWRHIWQVFEDQGANQYATWVWEPSCLEPSARLDIAKMQPPEKYYPGDTHVDWIGLSAFSRKGSHGDGMLFEGLIHKTYAEMRKNHPQKPIMQAETGKSQMWDQSKWLIDAYKTIKSMPGLKAAIYWDNVTTISIPADDKTLSDKSLQTLKEIFKDPYWIMAK